MNIHYEDKDLKDCQASDMADFLTMVQDRNFIHIWIKWHQNIPDPNNEKMTTVIIAFSAIKEGDRTSQTYYFENHRSKEPGCKNMRVRGTRPQIIEQKPAHDCSRNLKYQAEIGAPGKGYAYRCQICDAPYWTMDKQTFYPYRDIDPSSLELSISDVI